MRKIYTPLRNRLGKFGFLLSCLASALPLSNYGQAVTYSFTTGGATGATPPTQAQINTAYASTNLNGSVTVNNGIQSFTIPSTAPYRIIAIGAQGGYNGGSGAYISGDYTLTAGTVFHILVGQQGDSLNNNINNNGSGNEAGGGGGGSFVADPVNTPYVVAGGGGGNGDGYNGLHHAAPCCQNGMEASITTTGNGYAPPTTGGTAGTNFGVNGNGAGCILGSNAGGGAGFYGNGSTCNSGSAPLSFTNGGASGTGNNATAASGGFGGGAGVYNSGTGERGGGGGGYSGGGGGVANNSPTSPSYDGAGGGGGSYSSGANQTASLTANMGNGMVLIQLLCDVNLTASGTNSTQPTLCSGQSLTLSTSAVSNYSWSTGGTSQSIVVSPTVTTTYTVVGTSSLGCNNVAAITVTVSNAVPALTLTASSPSVCQGNSVTLSGSGALTYSYTSGATTSVAVVSPASSITYTLYGTNGCGTTNTTVAILVTPLPVVATTNTSTVCSGSTVTLTATGATTYTWYPSGAAANPFVAGPTANTIYTVIGQSGNCSTPATVAVNTNPLPTVTITASSTLVCSGDAVTLSASGTATSYTWSAGNQNNSSISVNPTQTTLYNLEGSNSFGCTDNTSQVILVSALPNLSVTNTNSVVCSGGSSTLTVSGANTYSWSGIASGHSIVVNPTSNTTYSVTGTNTAGCSATAMAEVDVFSPTILISSDVTAVCLGGHANLTASGADTYSWSNGSNLQSITVSPVTNTVYTVMGTGTDVNSGLSCDGTNSIALSINASPTVTAVASRSTICRGESDVLTASGATTYTWTGGSSAVMNATTSVSPIANQTFSVGGTDANGCKGAATILVQVAQCTGISVNSANNINVMIYPNPSNGEFTISSDQIITLQISNELGQQIRTVSLTDTDREVKINNLSNGIYFIKGKNENGSVMQKIIIAK